VPSDQAGDRFRLLFDDYWADIAAYARRRLPPADAADLAAEVFLIAWRRLADVPEGPAARLWLFGVARRVHANELRARRRRDRLHGALIEAFERGPHSTPPTDANHLAAAMRTLSEQDRELLRLTAWEGLRPAEIAVVLGCSANAATIRVHRARNRLATALADEDERTAPMRTCTSAEGRHP
jgi:RNA polymerase sigma-70 factor (ECF subfamily)